MLTADQKRELVAKKRAGTLSREDKILLVKEKREKEVQQPGFLEQQAKGLVGGLASVPFAPEILAGAEQLVDPAVEAFTGVDLPDETFEERAERFGGTIEGLKEQAPTAAGVGELAGLLGAVGPAAGRAAAGLVGKAAPKLAPGLARSTAVAGTEGALMGAVETRGDLEAAQEAAGISAAFPIAGRAIKGIGNFAKMGLRGASGVPDEVLDRYVKAPDEIEGALGKEAIKQRVDDAVSGVRELAESTELNAIDAIQEGLESTQRRLGESSQRSYDILRESPAQVPTGSILQSIDEQIASLVRRGGAEPFGPDSREALDQLRSLRASLGDAPELLDGEQSKALIQEIDQALDFAQRPGQFSSKTTQKLGQVRQSIDNAIKEQVPEYAAQMEEVSGLARLRSEAAQALDTPEKAKRVLRSSGVDKLPERRALDEIAARENINLEAYRRAQADLADFKNWDGMQSAGKIDALASGRNPEIKDRFQRLAQLSDFDFERQIRNMSDQAEFEKSFIRGSRNVNLWSLLGYMGAGGAIGGVPGALAGAFMDMYGPAVAKQVLKGAIRIQGIPTVRKINQLAVSPAAKKVLKDDLRRLVVGVSIDEPVAVEPEDVAIYEKDIKALDIPSTQKAVMLDELYKNNQVVMKPFYDKMRQPEASSANPQIDLSTIAQRVRGEQ